MVVGMNENNSKEVFEMSEILNNVFSNIDISKINDSNNLVKIWEETIQKIYKYGPKLAGHTKVVDLKNKILLVETDHPGWNQILTNYKDFILKNLKNSIPNLEIDSLAFKIKGDSVCLFETYEESKERQKQEYLKQLQETEKKLENMGFKSKNQEEINPEVKELFKGILGDN